MKRPGSVVLRTDKDNLSRQDKKSRFVIKLLSCFILFLVLSVSFPIIRIF